MNMTYNIRTLREPPSMDQTRVVIEAANYADAVLIAQESFKKTRRATSLGFGACGMTTYHRIEASGLSTDHCTNSGIPKQQQL